MKALLTWSTILVLAVSWLPSAHAQDGGYVAPSIIYTDDDPDRSADAGVNGLQISFGRKVHDHLDLEGLFGYSTLAGYSDATVSIPDVRITDFSANVLWYPNRDWTVAPYLIAGVGYLSAVPVSGQSTSGVSTTFGVGATWNIGGGPYSIRGEIRGRSSDGFDPSTLTTGTMTDTVATLGFQYDFSGRSSSTSLISGDGGWYIGGDVAYTREDKDRVTSSGTGAQFRAGKRLSDSFDLEALLGFSSLDGYSDTNQSFPDQSMLELGVNLLAYPNRDLRVAPYFLIGIGYLGTEFKPGDSGKAKSPQRLAPASIGILATAPIRFAANIGLRAASGTRAIDGTTGTLTDGIASIGVRYDFGAKRQYSEDDDTDGDGVLDIWDDCPNTEPGVEVSSRGCPLRDLRTDADGDRVPDDQDDCPNTPVGQVVDQRGCSLDSDGDGVVTGRDRCPASRPGAQVDSFGCERDNDQDGVVDHLDDCLNTRPGVRVDVNGCEITDIIDLPGVNFQTGSDLVVDGVEDILREVAETLNKYPELEIEVAGHTDSVGLGDANYGLSERRAVTVRDILIRYGVEEFRIRATGYGESQPIDDNNTAEGRARNRRVELRILNQ